MLKEETCDKDEQYRAIRHQRPSQPFLPTQRLRREQTDAMERYDGENGHGPKAVNVTQEHDLPDDDEIASKNLQGSIESHPPSMSFCTRPRTPDAGLSSSVVSPRNQGYLN